MSQFAHIEDEIIRNIENPEGTTVPIEFLNRSIKKYVTNEDGTQKVVHESEVFIRHYISKLSQPERKATQEDFRKYARQYEQFLNKQQQIEEGTPIELLPAISDADIENLKMAKVFTIERLAACPIPILHQIGTGSMKLQERANAYLQQSSVSALELKKALAEIEELKKQISEVKNEPINDSAKRSGRKPAIRATNDSNQ